MSQALLSKPLFTVLLMTGVISVVLALEPHPVTEDNADELLSERTSSSENSQQTTLTLNNTTATTAETETTKTDQQAQSIHAPSLAPWQRQLFQFKSVKATTQSSANMPMPVITSPPQSIAVVNNPVMNTDSSSGNLTTSVYTPNFPFQYLGRLVRDDKTTLFFSQQTQHIAVNEGDVIEKDWRLERVTEQTAYLRHLPTNRLQPLSLSDSE